MCFNKNKALYNTPNSFFVHLIQSIKVVTMPFAALAALALAVTYFFSKPATDLIPLRYMIIFFLLGSYFFVLLLHAGWKAFYLERPVLPSVRVAMPPPVEYQPGIALLILDPSEFFSYNSVVSIYYMENEVERLVGLGKIVNVQENKKIQVLVIRDINFTEGWNKLMSNTATELRNLKIKPTVPSFIMEAL